MRRARRKEKKCEKEAQRTETTTGSRPVLTESGAWGDKGTKTPSEREAARNHRAGGWTESTRVKMGKPSPDSQRSERQKGGETKGVRCQRGGGASRLRMG